MSSVQGQGPERRRHRRIDLTVPILTKPNTEVETQEFKGGVTKNLSLAGALFETGQYQLLSPDGLLTVSISIPREKARGFPFSRLAGRARIVRVNELAKLDDQSPKLLEVALEFGKDLTVLTAAPDIGD
ncbi:MAG: PilZ domain-containing protein [Candidatus Omnitrophica bacterium]|nr:PilZ domain-containing protein [Candidatus Omnitrophota bacterium]